MAAYPHLKNGSAATATAHRVMPKPDEYRTMADECLRSARGAQTKKERLMYLYMALKWLEQPPGKDARLPPAPRLKNVIGRLIK
jgi:hypothetical protein